MSIIETHLNLPNYGKLTLPADHNKQPTLKYQLETLEARRDLILIQLPYADHGAYGQDKKALEGINEKISRLTAELNEKISRLTAELEGLDRKQEREQARVEAADLRKQAAANSSKGGLI